MCHRRHHDIPAGHKIRRVKVEPCARLQEGRDSILAPRTSQDQYPSPKLIEERRRAPASPGAVDMSKDSLSVLRGIPRPRKLSSSVIPVRIASSDEVKATEASAFLPPKSRSASCCVPALISTHTRDVDLEIRYPPAPRGAASTAPKT